jgi:hypothetical protein
MWSGVIRITALITPEAAITIQQTSASRENRSKALQRDHRDVPDAPAGRSGRRPRALLRRGDIAAVGGDVVSTGRRGVPGQCHRRESDDGQRE